MVVAIELCSLRVADKSSNNRKIIIYSIVSANIGGLRLNLACFLISVMAVENICLANMCLRSIWLKDKPAVGTSK